MIADEAGRGWSIRAVYRAFMLDRYSKHCGTLPPGGGHAGIESGSNLHAKRESVGYLGLA